MLSQILLAITVLMGPHGNSDEIHKNWHQFRGPSGNGVAFNANPPIQWNADEAKWKTEIPGSGSASPIVWDDKIIILTAEKTEREKELLFQCIFAETATTSQFQFTQ